MRRSHLFAYIALCLIWGSTWMGVHILVGSVPPFLGAALRFLLATAVLFVWAALRKSKWPRDPGQWNAIIVLGFTMIAFPYGLQFWAQQYVTSSLSAVLFSATPLVVALLMPWMMHRSVPRQGVRAMLVAFGALVVLLCSDLQFGSRAFWGGIAVMVSMSGSAWSAVYAKVRLRDVDPVSATAVQLLIGSLALFWATWAIESHRHAVWTRSAVLALLFLATLGSAAAFAIYYWLLKHVQPYQASTINLVIPIVAVLEGAFFGRERVPLLMIVAMIMVLASVGVVLRAEAGAQPVEFMPRATGEAGNTGE